LKVNSHEDFSRAEAPEGSSDRTFGLVFTLFFLVIALWPLHRGGVIRWWSLPLSGVCLLLALACPAVLHPANVLWTSLAVFLNKIVSPIVTALLLYLVFTPVGILMRLSGKDPLRLRFEPNTKSYWIERRPPGPPPETMAQQF
jgi:predicted membrane metal-binding protein